MLVNSTCLYDKLIIHFSNNFIIKPCYYTRNSYPWVMTLTDWDSIIESTFCCKCIYFMCGNVRGYSNIMLRDTIVYTVHTAEETWIIFAFECSQFWPLIWNADGAVDSCAVDWWWSSYLMIITNKMPFQWNRIIFATSVLSGICEYRNYIQVISLMFPWVLLAKLSSSINHFQHFQYSQWKEIKLKWWLPG